MATKEITITILNKINNQTTIKIKGSKTPVVIVMVGVGITRKSKTINKQAPNHLQQMQIILMQMQPQPQLPSAKTLIMLLKAAVSRSILKWWALIPSKNSCRETCSRRSKRRLKRGSSSKNSKRMPPHLLHQARNQSKKTPPTHYLP